MEDELIKFDTSVLAKEKGFNVPTRLCYDNVDRTPMPYMVGNELYCNQLDYFSTPTQTILRRWLSEVHKIDVWVEHGTHKEIKKKRVLTHDVTISTIGCLRGGYLTYEEAMEFGLYTALKSI